MGIAKRKFNRHIKTLLHFDYPYFAEPGDGLRDEIGKLTWEAHGETTALAGMEIPCAMNLTPKFGWRCLYTKTDSADYIAAVLPEGYFDFKSIKSYEIEFFIRLMSPLSTGDIVALYNESNDKLFALLHNGEGKITAASADLALVGTTAHAMTVTEWHHVKFRLSNGQVKIFVDGVQEYSGSANGAITGATEIRLGGVYGTIDEFLIRDNLTGNDDVVPTEPHRGYIDTYGIGGDGHHGALNLQTGTSYINTCYVIKSITDTSTFTVNSLTEGTNSVGIQGQAQVGDELMIMKNQSVIDNLDNTESGLYVFRKIKNISSTTFTLDKPITSSEMNFSQGELANYYFEAVLVPHYTNVTIGVNATVKVFGSVENCGGLCVFRSKGNVVVNGKILTTAVKNRWRTDCFQMTHNHLPERLPLTSGGAAIILSEGTVTADDNARIGNSWSGAGTYGSGAASKGKGGNAGSGYGGGGSSYPADNYPKGGAGGVGYGGEDGWQGKNGGRPGSYHTSSSAHPKSDPDIYAMHTQADPWKITTHGYRNMAPGNCTNNVYSKVISIGGASVIIICKKISLSMNAISTGGQGGSYNTSGEGNVCHGSGTGFCYLAYEEAI